MNKLKVISLTLATTMITFFDRTQSALAQGGIDIPTIKPSDFTLIELMEEIGGWMLGIAGGIAVLYLIYGGIIYITGGEKGAEKGKAVIVNAIIGIAVIALATVITRAVINVVA